jgi:peptidoglycan/LPS O-acetylase OafA/YrhL
MPGWALVLSFLYGVIGFLFQTQLPRDKYLGLASAAAAYGLLEVPNLVFLAPIPIAYLTIYIGLLRLPKIPFGDRSYGIFLFHNPVLRTIFELSGGAMPIALLIPLTLTVTWLFASLSWAWIEKPIMRRKDRLLVPIDRICAMIATRTELLTELTKAARSRGRRAMAKRSPAAALWSPTDPTL